MTKIIEMYNNLSTEHKAMLKGAGIAVVVLIAIDILTSFS